MSWPWINPTFEEAKEAYFYNRGKYNSAAEELRIAQQQETQLQNDKVSLEAQIADGKEKVKKDKKRVEKVERLIKMMEGTGGLGMTDVPGAISKAQKSLEKADEDFGKAIIISGGGGKASIKTAFDMKGVNEDPYSSGALSEFKKEKSRLQQEISEFNVKVSNWQEQLKSVKTRLRTCTSDQQTIQNRMQSFAYDMNHYRIILKNEYDYYVNG